MKESCEVLLKTVQLLQSFIQYVLLKPGQWQCKQHGAPLISAQRGFQLSAPAQQWDEQSAQPSKHDSRLESRSLTCKFELHAQGSVVTEPLVARHCVAEGSQ